MFALENLFSGENMMMLLGRVVMIILVQLPYFFLSRLKVKYHVLWNMSIVVYSLLKFLGFLTFVCSIYHFVGERWGGHTKNLPPFCVEYIAHILVKRLHHVRIDLRTFAFRN